MSGSHLQYVLINENDRALLEEHRSNSSSCHLIWDSDNARLSPCALPYISIVPTAIIGITVIGHFLSPILRRWRPQWSVPFVVEFPPDQAEVPRENKSRYSGFAGALLALSVIGIAASVSQLVSPPLEVSLILSVISWVTAGVFIVLIRPRTCPISLLPFYSAALIVDLFYIINSGIPQNIREVAHYVTLLTALSSNIVILVMPFRDPSLPVADISPVGSRPNSDTRSPEDSLRLWQFLSVSWVAPLISIGKKRQLNEEDVWHLAFEFQHKRLHENFRQLRGTVVRRLLQANGIDVFIIMLTATVETFCEFTTPILLQQLLKSMENPFSPKRVALTYAFLSLVVRAIGAQSEVLTLWFGRRCYERTRGEMTMMVYEKALSRKNIIGQKEEIDAEETRNGTPVNGMNGKSIPSRSKWWNWRIFVGKPKKDKNSKSETKPPASMGKILNLIRGDVYEVSQRFWEIENLVAKPLGLVLGVVLIWELLGPSCFVGISTIIVAQALNVFVTRVLLRWERLRRVATDSRLQVTSQYVEAIRHLRWYGWQDHWLGQIMEARQHELYLRVVTTFWRILITFTNSLASGMFPVVALYAYTLMAGQQLRIDIIFPALQLFAKLDSSLREIPNIITVLLNAYVAVGRIEDFMAEPDKESAESDFTINPTSLEFVNATFAWPGTSLPVLRNLNLKFKKNFSVICGKVGAGKTALLQALLGELDKLDGKCHIPDEMIAYCAQTPWLQSMSIRDNILFFSPYEEQRYREVLEACALLPDLANFKHGDLSFIGENGIGLSGGQKARVALARAVYSRATILLLDDPISALDFNTAESIVHKCFDGPLMKDRTVILVTHRVDLVHELAEQVVEISDGEAVVSNRSAELIERIANGMAKKSLPETAQGDIQSDDTKGAIPDKFIEEEHRAEWGVQARVYWKYIKSGKLKWWATLIIALAVYRFIIIGQSWFVKAWGEAYSEVIRSFVLFSGTGELFSAKSGMFNAHPNTLPEAVSINPIDDFPPPEDNVKPWLLAFFVISSCQSVALFVSQLFMLVIIYCAGKQLFMEVMISVSKATFRFYDVTPVGRLMNRLTSDIGTVDGNISQTFQGIAFQSITWVASVFIIATVTPTFLVFSFALTAAFVYIFLQFLPTSQSLRRLEMVSLSPLMSNFGELLHGLTTVRAFHAEHRFQDRVISVVDQFQGMDHFYWSVQNWLMYRFDNLAAISTFILTVLALYTNVSPGLTAFVLIAATQFVGATRYLCRRYGQLQMDFVSVERVDELLHVDQEPTGSIDPPAAWPIFGSAIVFEKVTIRYASHLDPSLIDISLRIPGGSTTAIVGRTGSGKSTLAISLLAVVRPESGHIWIDNMDIAEIDTAALRTRVTFVAQDPVLFAGSIRRNLDPTDTYSDEDRSAVLERLCGRHGWTLDTYVESGGRNLSQGQRQLIGLTRAVLRRSPIVILDEATASIDYESSMEIQQILREEMKEATVIMIAHRVEAVKGADFAIMLDKGRIVKQGPANEMLEQKDEDLTEALET